MRFTPSRRPALRSIVLAALFVVVSANADDSLNQYRSGLELTEQAAAKLEARLSKKPKDWKARVSLLGYWTHASLAPPETIREARSRHLLWLIEKRPATSLLASPYFASINSEGHPLADPAAFEQARTRWLAHARAASASTEILLHAAVFLSVQDPVAAIEALQRTAPEVHGVEAAWGQACAAAYIGALGVGHSVPFALQSSPALAGSDLAKVCVKRVRASNSAEFLSSFIIKAARDGGQFYSSEAIDWDYTPLLTETLPRARALDADQTALAFVPGIALPSKDGTQPGMVYMIGDQAKLRLRHSVPPVYPQPARSLRIQGTAKLLAFIGPDGTILRLESQGGHEDLVTAAAAAVSQWRYEGLEYAGRPFVIVTPVHIHFTLG